MPISRRHFTAALALTPALGLPAWGQQGNWPNKPLRVICPYPPGGSADIITRFVSDRISKELGQPVIVENRPGAGATLGTEFAVRMEPDGYNFFITPTATVTVAPWLRPVKYAPDSFAAIAKLSSSYGLISARKDAPFSDYREFVAAAKANPGKYTFASNGVGSIVHLTAVRLHSMAGIDVVHVPYKGAIESMNDMLGGRIDLMYDPVTLPRVQEGALKALATSGLQRNPALPELPTLQEQGFELNTASWFGLFAPKGTPADIVERMAQAAEQSLSGPEVRAQLELSSMYPDFEGPAAFGKRVQADAATMRDIIKKENIKVE
ncbi:tripartite tricarboxylate transporter substrate binding protein [Verticiella sediminum]|uniref:Tripartite tricarboxylate transporter substrate binding protein n=1 Tax=Verticiella sediminum TaxID=1247510 RepID=A0A556B0Y0_9BURK|nr:tripartite tricarboxylate transporter substrate binding protein [Verticiella sediminum]TSH98846.1 tripartite tricarboxylate transporter substrate binding protein [Verticiella sediminum]